MTAWQNFANEGNTKIWGSAFRWAKNGTRLRDPPSVIRMGNGQLTEDIESTAAELLKVFVPDDEYNINDFNPDVAEHSPNYGDITHEEVKAAIWRMGPNKAPGPDGITAHILRKAWPYIEQRLVKLFGDVLNSGEFPDVWKQADLILIRKKDKEDSTNAKSYRPISLLSATSKALETLITRRLKLEISTNMSSRQHGFMTNRSTLSAVDQMEAVLESTRNRYGSGYLSGHNRRLRQPVLGSSAK